MLATIGTDKLSSTCILLEKSSTKVHEIATHKITSEEKLKDNKTITEMIKKVMLPSRLFSKI